MPPSPQAKYWLLTIPHHAFMPYLPTNILYLRGQLELGANTGFLHWQLLAIFDSKVRLASVKRVFGDGIHAEPSKSNAANDYVWKEETRVEGTQFELGNVPLKRNSKADWDAIKELARNNRLDEIPAEVFVRNYNSLKRIAVDNMVAAPIERRVDVFWGPTGVGKSRRAWGESGFDAYPKDPRTKFWDGYRGQQHVVIDEFRGGIDVAHLLRWFDRYPVIVEVKGSSVVFCATRIWITSNLDPREWYPDLDESTKAALMRRLNVFHMVQL